MAAAAEGATSLGVVTDIVKCQLLLHFTSSCVVAVHRVSLPGGGVGVGGGVGGVCVWGGGGLLSMLKVGSSVASVLSIPS